MPKRKKIPEIPDNSPYLNLPEDVGGMEVTKNPALIPLAQSELELSDLKLLDLYLGRINGKDPSKDMVILDKGVIEQALGVDRIRKEDLRERLRSLMQPLTVDDREDGCILIPLFDVAIMQRDTSGLWVVSMQCTRSAAKYIFTKDALRYIGYYIRDVIELSSRYSYVLYLYLKDNRFRGSWEISIDELKERMRVRSTYYDQFKEFNRQILKKCQEEINAKTSINFDYEPTARRGRKYTKIRFTITKDLEIDDAKREEMADQLKGQLTFDDCDQDELNLYSTACNGEFDAADLSMIAIALNAYSEILPTPKDRAEWLCEMYTDFAIAASKQLKKGGKIFDRAAYLVKMLRSTTPKQRPKPSEPSYDMDAWADMANNCDPTFYKNDKEDNT